LTACVRQMSRFLGKGTSWLGNLVQCPRTAHSTASGHMRRYARAASAYYSPAAVPMKPMSSGFRLVCHLPQVTARISRPQHASDMRVLTLRGPAGMRRPATGFRETSVVPVQWLPDNIWVQGPATRAAELLRAGAWGRRRQTCVRFVRTSSTLKYLW
jgi:hypothetical protein